MIGVVVLFACVAAGTRLLPDPGTATNSNTVTTIGVMDAGNDPRYEFTGSSIECNKDTGTIKFEGWVSVADTFSFATDPKLAISAEPDARCLVTKIDRRRPNSIYIQFSATPKKTLFRKYKLTPTIRVSAMVGKERLVDEASFEWPKPAFFADRTISYEPIKVRGKGRGSGAGGGSGRSSSSSATTRTTAGSGAGAGTRGTSATSSGAVGGDIEQ